MNYKLTVKSIEDISLDEDLKSKKIADGGGLHLLVTRTGKYWRFNYRINHKQKTLALGTYPVVRLKPRAKRINVRVSYCVMALIQV